MDNTDNQNIGTGRCSISEVQTGNRGRMHFSKRAARGTIQVIRAKCPHCGHHKAIRNESPNSPFYDHITCCKCKKRI